MTHHPRHNRALPPSGEALARQLLLAQRAFRDQHGRLCSVFWLPEVPGGNGQLPQLMRLAGMTRFVVQPPGWQGPGSGEHHSVRWRGLNGSEVSAHRFPASLPGGASRWQGLPPAEALDNEFSSLALDERELPLVVGELRRGHGERAWSTAIAGGSRRLEDRLHDVEFLSAVAGRLGRLSYPSADLSRLWSMVLDGALHGALPSRSASATGEADDYHRAERELHALRERAARALLEDGGDLLPLNTLPFHRREVAEAPGTGPCWVESAPYGVGRVSRSPDEVVLTELERGGYLLENSALRAEILPDGSVLSVVHRASGREALSAPANLLALHGPGHEPPAACPPARALRVLERGGLRAELEFERDLGAAGSLRQSIRLDAAARRLEFHGALEQSGVEQVLSASFPIAVRSLRASFETPFGVVERPTHDAADDRAARAVPGQRFAAVGEHGFGVALLSADADSVSALEGTLRLNLVGAPAPPDRAHGARHFSYAIYPHQNSWQAAEVVAEARRFTVPITWVRGQSEARSFLTCHDGNLVLDTIKRGEEGYALILRLYEAHGARGRAQIETALSFSRASVCDLLEREISPLKLSRGMLEVSYLPFQILTLKLE